MPSGGSLFRPLFPCSRTGDRVSQRATGGRDKGVPPWYGQVGAGGPSRMPRQGGPGPADGSPLLGARGPRRPHPSEAPLSQG